MTLRPFGRTNNYSVETHLMGRDQCPLLLLLGTRGIGNSIPVPSEQGLCATSPRERVIRMNSTKFPSTDSSDELSLKIPQAPPSATAQVHGTLPARHSAMPHLESHEPCPALARVSTPSQRDHLHQRSPLDSTRRASPQNTRR